MKEDTRSAYERAFRSLLWRLRPRQLQRGVQRLEAKAAEEIRLGADPETAWFRVHGRLRERVIGCMVRNRTYRRAAAANREASPGGRFEQQMRATLENSVAKSPLPDSPDFHCDSGLGGLARWLRAAGYDAHFWPRIDDDEILHKTVQSNAILLTTDGPLMGRSAVVWGAVPALLIPLSVGKHEQFRFAARQLGLPRKSPRCMACGGHLQSVHKETVRDRIPPRTYPWRDEYYECERCGKLLWRGTHWANVTELLDAVVKQLDRRER